MGFLDRLVSDLIQDNTGIPARRLVRMVGGKNILMAGAGAALAGGLAAAASQRQQTAPAVGQRPAPPPPPPIPEASTAPPPPPPIPGATGGPPPLPVPQPASSEEPAETEIPQELTYAIVRTMVAAALADGEMAPQEKELVHKHLGESGLGPEQTRQVHQDLVLPPSPEELAALAADGEAREALYRFAALVVLADDERTDLERRWLDRLAAAFELADDRKSALEAEVFTDDG